MRRYARHIVGLAALALLAALFLLAFYRGRVPEDKAEVKSLGKAAILLEPEELPDLIGILQEDGRLRAGDGFGLDITENVTCKRTWLSGENYTILFRVSNGYGDMAEAMVSAVISGEVEHPELELSAISVTIPVGEAFDPYSYILSARDSDGTDRQGDVQVGTVPDTSVPGTYQVAYTLTSSDGMEQVKKYLTVATLHCSLSRLREEPGLARRIRQTHGELYAAVTGDEALVYDAVYEAHVYVAAGEQADGALAFCVYFACQHCGQAGRSCGLNYELGALHEQQYG